MDPSARSLTRKGSTQRSVISEICSRYDKSGWFPTHPPVLLRESVGGK